MAIHRNDQKNVKYRQTWIDHDVFIMEYKDGVVKGGISNDDDCHYTQIFDNEEEIEELIGKLKELKQELYGNRRV